MDLDSANTYFEIHLDSTYWSSATEERRIAALNMAEQQIKAVSNRDIPEAVYEQAIYLLRNHDTDASGRVISSQSLDGVGSQSFQYLTATSGAYAGIANNAVRLLKAMTSATVTLTRG